MAEQKFPLRCTATTPRACRYRQRPPFLLNWKSLFRQTVRIWALPHCFPKAPAMTLRLRFISPSREIPRSRERTFHWPFVNPVRKKTYFPPPPSESSVCSTSAGRPPQAPFPCNWKAVLPRKGSGHLPDKKTADSRLCSGHRLSAATMPARGCPPTSNLPT